MRAASRAGAALRKHNQKPSRLTVSRFVLRSFGSMVVVSRVCLGKRSVFLQKEGTLVFWFRKTVFCSAKPFFWFRTGHDEGEQPPIIARQPHEERLGAIARRTARHAAAAAAVSSSSSRCSSSSSGTRGTQQDPAWSAAWSAGGGVSRPWRRLEQ
eukprot:COSAG06_NODE_3548_length_5199_cov_166.747059_3_plen_155_part_00